MREHLHATTVEPAGTGSPDPIGADDVPSLRRRLLVPTLVLSGSLMAVVSSLGAPLIPTLSRADGVSLSTGEWILTITLLTGALATPVMGRLADGPRQRAVILVALGAVVVGCVLSAVSNGFTVLIIGRALQGVGLGLLPVAMAIARRNLPPDAARQTIATLSVTAAIGAGLGYPVTGLIAQLLNFRAAYWFGAITVTGALVSRCAGPAAPLGRHLPALRRRGRRPAQPGGHRGLGGAQRGRRMGLGLGSLPRCRCRVGGRCWRSGSPSSCACAHPLVDLRQVRNRSVLTADVSGFLISIAMYLLLPIIVEFVQIPRSAGYGFGASLVVSGLVLIPLSVGSFVASRFLVVYERRFGPRTMIPLGSVVFAVGAMFFALEHSALWEAFVTVAVCGLGVGFTTGAMPGFIIRAVAPERDRERYGLLPGGAQHRLDGGKRAERRRADGPHPARSGPAGRGRLQGGPDHRGRPVPGHRGGQLRAARTGAVAPQRTHRR